MRYIALLGSGMSERARRKLTETVKALIAAKAVMLVDDYSDVTAQVIREVWTLGGYTRLVVWGTAQACRYATTYGHNHIGAATEQDRDRSLIKRADVVVLFGSANDQKEIAEKLGKEIKQAK